MKPLRAACLIHLVVAVGLTACSSPAPTDGGDVVTEAGPHDGGDAMPTDGGDGGDAGNLGTCNMVNIENLNALGMTSGGHLDFVSNNMGTPSGPAVGIQVSSLLQTTATGTGPCNFRIGHQRVFAYTPMTNSVLRISTTNMGTDPWLDTVIYVADGTMVSAACSAHPTSTTVQRTWLGCNDDDLNYSGDQRHISSTAVTLKQVTAGHMVLIGLGGFVPAMGTADETREVGQFELTVEELPVVSAGASCDTRRLMNACADGATCVSNNFPGTAGTCQMNGMVAGAACDTMGNCSGTGLMCDANTGFCVAQGVADGMPCNQFNQCGTNSTCVLDVVGGAGGTCRANGSVVNAACDATQSCSAAAGLACDVTNGGVCRLAITGTGTGMACNAFVQVCPQNAANPANSQDCVVSTPTGLAGTCVQTATTPGTHCTTGSCSGTNEMCNNMLNPPTCQTTSATGGVCNTTAQCGSTDNCFLTDLNDVFDGTCYTGGSLGGACPCSGTLMCSNTIDPTQGRCGNAVADGGACDLTSVCPMNDTCVQDPTMTGFHGACHAQGAVVGSQCIRMPASGMPSCASGLTCSSWIPEEGICQRMSTDGTCDPRTAQVRCPGTQVCRSSSIHSAGACATPTMETEPNDGPSSANMVTAPAAVQASLSFADVDCYGVSVPAGNKIYAAATSLSGVCGGLTNLALDVYRVDATHNNLVTLLGTDTNSGTDRCPRIEGGDPSHNFDWAQNTGTAAETWYVCLRNNDPSRNPVSTYVLSINTSP